MIAERSVACADAVQARAISLPYFVLAGCVGSLTGGRYSALVAVSVEVHRQPAR
jgi:hypothetical protein